MVAVVACPQPVLQFFDNAGKPAAGGSILTQVGGVNFSTYSDSAGATPLPNPIALNSRGEVSTAAGATSQLFVVPNTIYTFTLSDAAGNLLNTATYVNGTQLTNTQASIGALLYPQTAAELAALITPTNYSRPPGDFIRYGLASAATPTANVTAINQALSCNTRCFCYDAGTYQVNASLNVASNQTIELAQGVTIQGAAAIAWAANGIFNITSQTNVTIRGGVIDGNKANNASGTVFGVKIYDSSKIRIEGVSCNNCPGSAASGVNGGDGFYIGGATATGSTDIALNSCIADGNVRQGCSIVKGSRIAITGGSYINTTGTAPGAGIDIEANSGADTLVDISVVGANVSGNYWGIIITTAANGVTIDDNKIRGNRLSAIYVSGCQNVVATGNTIISGITVAAPIIDCAGAVNVKFADNLLVGTSVSPEGGGFRIQSATNLEILDNTFSTTFSSAIIVGFSAITAAPNNIVIGRNTFLNCVDSTATGVAVISANGNSGSSIWPLLLDIFDNKIVDTRSGGPEADFAISINNNIPLATQAGYRIRANRISGPAAIMTSTLLPPLAGSVVWNPASLADGAGETSPDFVVTGAALGDSVEIFSPYDLQGMVVSGYVQAAGIVKVRLQNESGGVLDLASATWRVRVNKLLEA